MEERRVNVLPLFCALFVIYRVLEVREPSITKIRLAITNTRHGNNKHAAQNNNPTISDNKISNCALLYALSYEWQKQYAMPYGCT